MKKPWYASLTIAVNAVMGLLAAFIPGLQDQIAAHPAASAVLAAVVNVGLRLKSDKPVS